jgi:hypothetical protein
MTQDNANVALLRSTAGALTYNPPSYTCIREFVNSFPVPPPVEFDPGNTLANPVWVPEPPYPRIYTENYRKSVLSTLTKTMEKI